MVSALEALLRRGEYMFRVESFVMEQSALQDADGMKVQTSFYLTAQSLSGGWPQFLLPSDVRIVAAKMATFDKTADGQTVLGLIRRGADGKVQLMLLALPEQTAVLLTTLNTERRPTILKVETLKQIEKWDGEGWVAVVSWELVLGK